MLRIGGFGDTRSGSLFIPPQTRDTLFWMETHVPGGKGSCMGSVLLQSSPEVSPPSKRRYLGNFVIGNCDLSRWKAEGR